MFYTRQALLKLTPCLSHGNTYLKQSHVLHMGNDQNQSTISELRLFIDHLQAEEWTGAKLKWFPIIRFVMLPTLYRLIDQ